MSVIPVLSRASRRVTAYRESLHKHKCTLGWQRLKLASVGHKSLVAPT